MQRLILTPQEVAHLVGVTAETVIRWADQGRISGFRLPNGRWRFHRAEIERLIGAGLVAELLDGSEAAR